jgi:hypothetical protein
LQSNRPNRPAKMSGVLQQYCWQGLQHWPQPVSHPQEGSQQAGSQPQAGSQQADSHPQVGSQQLDSHPQVGSHPQAGSQHEEQP